jgi:glutamate transport system permease protein
MGWLFEAGNFSLFWHGFVQTVELSAVSGLLALLLGAVLAACRVCPVPVLRVFSAVWVGIFRNTPLTLLFFAVTFGLPRLDVHLSAFAFAALALACYTASFVCEVLRSGINTVPVGQAEAARSIGLTFGQTLTLVVLPQASRSVLGPLSSVFIALPRNSAIAGVFNVAELYSVQATLFDRGYAVFAVFFWIALAYLLLSATIRLGFAALERRVAVAA